MHTFTDQDLDPYYTLVSYYNTLKNLGAAIRMYEDTVPSYMGVISNTSENRFQTQNNAEKIDVKVLEKEELTGRVNAAKIPTILRNIEMKIGDENVLDALLCTNILSVGVDVERLNVMVNQRSTKKCFRIHSSIWKNREKGSRGGSYKLCIYSTQRFILF